MGLSRRNGNRFQASIWPGFVDAMTGLLLVLMFVITIFMVVQYVLRDTISGQETKLDALSVEISELAKALGLEQLENTTLEGRIGALDATLGAARQQVETQASLIASLTSQRETQDRALAQAQNDITGFEAQVAGLLAQRDQALGTVAALEGERAALISQQEAVQLALAQARNEIDAGVQAARLAAAKRAAFEALMADLRVKSADAEANNAKLTTRIEILKTTLSEQDALRIAESAAAAALQERLKNADSELTAMTLALEEQRQNAEDTLTMLAAAEAAGTDLDTKIAAALIAQEAATGRLSELEAALALAVLDGEKNAIQMAEMQIKMQEAEHALLSAERTAGTQIQEQTVLQQQFSEIETTLARAAADAEENKAAMTDLQESLRAREVQLAQAQGQTQTVSREREILAAQLAAALVAKQDDDVDRAEIRAQLAAALAAKMAARAATETQLTKSEQRAVLLATANNALAQEEARSAESQRQTALLSQQVAALHTQLSGLQALLDDAKIRDVAAKVQLQSLGSDLNTALARAAAEQRKRAELETAERKRLEDETKDLVRYKSEFFGRLRDVIGAQEGVKIVGDRFVFSSEVLFPSGGADLSEAGQIEVAKIAAILHRVIGDIPQGIDWVIRVDGHTDNRPLSGGGQFRDNWELSQARALSVVRYLAKSEGIPADRLAANGFGEYQPINEEDTEDARAQNRRIELKFTEK